MGGGLHVASLFGPLATDAVVLNWVELHYWLHNILAIRIRVDESSHGPI